MSENSGIHVTSDVVRRMSLGENNETREAITYVATVLDRDAPVWRTKLIDAYGPDLRGLRVSEPGLCVLAAVYHDVREDEADDPYTSQGEFNGFSRGYNRVTRFIHQDDDDAPGDWGRAVSSFAFDDGELRKLWLEAVRRDSSVMS